MKNTLPTAHLMFSESAIAGSVQGNPGGNRGGNRDGNEENGLGDPCGRAARKTNTRPTGGRDACASQNLTRLHPRLPDRWRRYLDAVVLFSMLTTCTRRFTSASG